MRTIRNSAADAFGRTFLVRPDRITSALGLDGTIFAEIGYRNPDDSIKDRIAVGIIEEAERLDTLKLRQSIAELTSGNTGTRLSIACAIKGYRFVAINYKGNSIERACKMRALGAEVVLIDQMLDSVPRQVSRPYLQPVEEKAKQVEIGLRALRADK